MDHDNTKTKRIKTNRLSIKSCLKENDYKKINVKGCTMIYQTKINWKKQGSHYLSVTVKFWAFYNNSDQENDFSTIKDPI